MTQEYTICNCLYSNRKGIHHGRISEFKFRPGCMQQLYVDVHIPYELIYDLSDAYFHFHNHISQLGIMNHMALPYNTLVRSVFELSHDDTVITSVNWVDDGSGWVNHPSKLERVVEICIEKYENNEYVPNHISNVLSSKKYEIFYNHIQSELKKITTH